MIRQGHGRRDFWSFYMMYLDTMKGHGALPRSFGEFALSERYLSQNQVYRLLFAEFRGTPIAGAVVHVLGDTVQLLYNASARGQRHLRPNHALYWHIASTAISSGQRRFDFGAAAVDSGLAEFKRQWGAREVPVYEYVYRPGGESRATDRLLSTHHSLQDGHPGLLTRVWQRTPLIATAAAGHVLYRWA